jgi:hypothetical protein
MEIAGSEDCIYQFPRHTPLYGQAGGGIESQMVELDGILTFFASPLSYTAGIRCPLLTLSTRCYRNNL